MRPFNPFTDISTMLELATLVVVAVTGILAWLRRRKAVAWPSTQGVVQSCRTLAGKHRGWICVLTYSYVANGEYYSGAHPIKARSENVADELAALWKGRPVVVRYAPSNHAVSVLLKDDQIGGFSN